MYCTLFATLIDLAQGPISSLALVVIVTQKYAHWWYEFHVLKKILHIKVMF